MRDKMQRILFALALSLGMLRLVDASDQWLPKAREEGRVAVYTSFNQADLPKLIDPFSRKYPGIHVEVIRGVATSLLPRVTTEIKAGKGGDLVFTKAEYLDLLKNQNFLQLYKSPEQITAADGYVTGVWVSA